jgi:hypothetical protein
MFFPCVDHLGSRKIFSGNCIFTFDFLVSMFSLTILLNYFIIPTLASFFLNNFNRFNSYPSRYLWYQVYWPTNLEHLLRGLHPCQLLLMLLLHFLSHRYYALNQSKYGSTNGFLKSSLILCFLSFQWRTKFRKAMNKADNDATTRVIDSLINYEVSISFTNTNIYIYLCCLILSSI